MKAMRHVVNPTQMRPNRRPIVSQQFEIFTGSNAMYTHEIHEDGYPQAGVVSVIVRGSTRRGVCSEPELTVPSNLKVT